MLFGVVFSEAPFRLLTLFMALQLTLIKVKRCSKCKSIMYKNLKTALKYSTLLFTTEENIFIDL